MDARLVRYSHHCEASAVLPANIDAVFAYLDDPERLAGHMTQSSWTMGGGQMRVELDQGRGRTVGSRIIMAGRAFGLELYLEEAIEEREPPRRKVWETVGTPRLVVIGAYRMGFEVGDEGVRSRLRIFLDYELPARRKLLGLLFGPAYARWCTRRMVSDARRHFGRTINGAS